jgi:hypothetical protein
MDRGVFLEASALEAASPRDALRLYAELDRQNTDDAPMMLAVGAIGPAIAAAIAYLVARAIPAYQTEVTLIILILGYAPIFMVQKRALLERGVSKPPVFVNIVYYVLMPVLVILQDVLQLAIILLVSAVTWIVLALPISLMYLLLGGPPFVAPWELPTTIGSIGIGICIAFWLAYVLADLNPQMFTREPVADHLEMIPVGIRLRAADIVQFFGGLLLGVILVGSGPLELLFEHQWEAVVLSGITGLMLAYAFRSTPGDLVLDHLIEIGRARALIRLGRIVEARWRMEQVIFAPASHRPVQLGVVASAVHTMASNRTAAGEYGEIPGYLRAAGDVHGTKLEPYGDLWQDVVVHTQALHGHRAARLEDA